MNIVIDLISYLQFKQTRNTNFDQFQVVYNIMIESHLSKASLISWIREVTSLPVTKLQDLSTGVHFCVLLHQLTQKKFQLSKVNYKAKLQYQSLHNLKQLQYGFQSNGVSNKFEINKIASKNVKVILEILQWFRKQFLKRPIQGGNLQKGKIQSKQKQFSIKLKNPYVKKEEIKLNTRKEDPQSQAEKEHVIKNLRKDQQKVELIQKQLIGESHRSKEKSKSKTKKQVSIEKSHRVQKKQNLFVSEQQKGLTQTQKRIFYLRQNLTFGQPQPPKQQNNQNCNSNSNNLGQPQLKYPSLDDPFVTQKQEQMIALAHKSVEKIEPNHYEASVTSKQKQIFELKNETGQKGQRIINSPSITHKFQFNKSNQRFVEKVEVDSKLQRKTKQFSEPKIFLKNEEKKEEVNEEKSKSKSKYSNLLSSQESIYKTRMI